MGEGEIAKETSPLHPGIGQGMRPCPPCRFFKPRLAASFLTAHKPLTLASKTFSKSVNGALGMTREPANEPWRFPSVGFRPWNKDARNTDKHDQRRPIGFWNRLQLRNPVLSMCALQAFGNHFSSFGFHINPSLADAMKAAAIMMQL